ncbi:hypothetical protein [Sutcliffiella horikoshii]|uniref:Uncharacterized protein n=1 Tax=Sutcliffiella horikoshii TaxID=79883 RepID=A0A5D4TFR8_9BACI|nr:hypothetical protein [Sutcliffiella horikoshii]TYS72954.1 hypothetical protein FZC75_07760 [Sutcliffiella horikoshii]
MELYGLGFFFGAVTILYWSAIFMLMTKEIPTKKGSDIFGAIVYSIFGFMVVGSLIFLFSTNDAERLSDNREIAYLFGLISIVGLIRIRSNNWYVNYFKFNFQIFILWFVTKVGYVLLVLSQKEELTASDLAFENAVSASNYFLIGASALTIVFSETRRKKSNKELDL